MMPGEAGTGPYEVALALLVDVVLLKATVLVLSGLAFQHLLRGTSAAHRHAIWAAVVATLLLSPALRLWGPTWESAAVVEFMTRGSADASAPIPAERAVSPVSAEQHAAPAPSERSPTASHPSQDPRSIQIGQWYRVPVVAWLTGVLVLVTALATELLRAVGLRKRATSAPPRIRSAAGHIARRMYAARVPTVLISHEVMVPGAFGCRRPCVILPSQARHWTDERLDAVLLHEIGHLLRRDVALHIASLLVRALYWPNPAVWLAERRLAHERELACDDRVLAGKVNPVQYAEHLLHLARSSRAPDLTAAAVPLLGRSELARRVRSILDTDRPRSPLSRRWLIGVTLLVASAAIPAGAIEILSVGRTHPGLEIAVARMGDPDPATRRHAAWTLGALESRRATSTLIHALNDTDPDVRTLAVWALGEVKDAAAREALFRALHDVDEGVREMAVLALGELEDPRVLDTLQTLAHDPALRGPVTWATAEAVSGDAPPVWAGRLQGPPVDPDGLRGYLLDLASDDAGLRVSAAERLGRLGHAMAVEPLIDALADGDPAVRAMAVWALDEIRANDAQRGLDD